MIAKLLAKGSYKKVCILVPYYTNDTKHLLRDKQVAPS